MKATLILSFLMPISLLAQDDLYGSNAAKTKLSQAGDSIQYIIDKYKVENRAVTYVTVYDLQGKTQQDIKNLAIKAFSTNPKLSITQASISEDQISGTISNFAIDYRKYGFKWGNMAVWALHPAFADFIVQFKDGRYRVIIKAIKTVVNPNLSFEFNSDFATKENTLGGINNKTAQRGYYSFGKSMDELFQINQTKDAEW